MLSNSKFVTVFNLPLAVVAGWLLWRSLDWPLVGDAAIFHFIASQFQMGAIQYRDIFDINMPLIYYIHAAVIAIGGIGDGAWRAFDLTAAVLMSGLGYSQVPPPILPARDAGRRRFDASGACRWKVSRSLG